MRKLVFVTNNANKLREVGRLLAKEFEIVSLKDIGFHEEIEETEQTIEGNALLKARHIYKRYGLDCFADDTGLEIEALGGRPGVYSARYAGLDCSPGDNINKVLGELQGENHRIANFRTVIALIMDGQEYTFEGNVEGEILRVRKGSDGFGYDPIFRPKGFSASFAEMPLEEKNKISHRGRAVKKLVAFCKNS